MPIQDSTQKIHHLGIVAEMCNEIGLVEIIDSIIPKGDKQIVSNGNIVKALILNMLDIGQHPLYLMPGFFKALPLGRLFYEELEYNQINDSAIGRVLDRLSDDNRLETIFMTIASKTVKTYDRFTSSLLHVDTSSMSVHGEYDNIDNPDLIKITFGKSKDGRNDLKQFMISMVTSNRIPVFMKLISGNTSDKTHFRELVDEFGKDILKMFNKAKFFVFDSEFYVSKTLKTVDPSLNWITRVPEKCKQAVQLVESDNIKWIKSIHEGYKFSYHTSDYGGVKDQQWLLVYSEKAHKRENDTLLRNIKKLRNSIEKKLWHLSKQEFDSEKAAIKELNKIAKRWKYHKVDSFVFRTTKKKATGGKGRPSKNSVMIDKISIDVEFMLCDDKFGKASRKKGRFILATNRYLDGDELLQNYKQQNNVERGFRFLKDSLFFVDGIFLKNEKRIMALGMILGLALLVYNLSELRMREAFKINEEVFTSHYRPATPKPTIRHVFQVFDALHIISLKHNHKIIHENIPNLKPKHRQVLRLMGENYLKMYESKGEDLYALLGKFLDD